jgi:hypothetical protein
MIIESMHRNLSALLAITRVRHYPLPGNALSVLEIGGSATVGPVLCKWGLRKIRCSTLLGARLLRDGGTIEVQW